MVELVALAALVFVGLAIAAVVGVVLVALKIVLWTVLLPFRILLKLLWLPIWLGLGAIGLLFGTLAIPVVLLVVGGVIVFGLFAAIVGLMLPAIPFILLGLLIWSIARRRPAVA
jgi:hypothetical protein